MSFQTTVVAIFSIILIIFLVIIGVTLNDSKKKGTYPPKISQCPDYWTLDKDDNCVNINSLGNSTCSSKINIKDDAWNGKDGQCNKYKWANACGITWDGVTNIGLDCNKK